jgi:hypothetical protein
MRQNTRRLGKSEIGRGTATTGAEALLISLGLRGPEGPLFHGKVLTVCLKACPDTNRSCTTGCEAKNIEHMQE